MACSPNGVMKQSLKQMFAKFEMKNRCFTSGILLLKKKIENKKKTKIKYDTKHLHDPNLVTESFGAVNGPLATANFTVAALRSRYLLN